MSWVDEDLLPEAIKEDQRDRKSKWKGHKCDQYSYQYTIHTQVWLTENMYREELFEEMRNSISLN